MSQTRSPASSQASLHLGRLLRAQAQTFEFRKMLREMLHRARGDEAVALEDRIKEVETDLGILAGRIAEAQAQA